jgi:phospholipid/cholesterol/gamma-HCH transport system substrate-binding protein
MWFAEGGGGGPKVFFKASFEGPVTGLGDGTIVRFNGIEVGNVTALATQADNPQNVLVTLQIQADTYVRQNSQASVEVAGLTGPSYVEISGGTRESARKLGGSSAAEAPLIPAIKSKVQKFLDDAQKLVDSFGEVTTQVKLILSDENRNSISGLLAHLNNTTAVFDEHSKDLGDILKNFQTASFKINGTLQNTDRTLALADKALGTADHALGTLDSTLASAKTTVESVGRFSDHADKAVSGLDVAQINRLMAETRTMVSGITRLSTSLERQPSKLIYGDNRQGYSPR